jgi:hypothetical protein
MVFKRRDTGRSTIVIDNKIIEQVNSFHYLENLILYDKEVDIENKLNNYSKITGIMNNMCRLRL